MPSLLRAGARVLCVLVIALMTSPAEAQQHPAATDTAPPEYDSIIAQGLQQFGASHWAEARVLFERAHAIFPNARTQRGIGMCAFELGDYAGASLALAAALEDQRRPLTDEQRRAATELLARARALTGRFVVPAAPAGSQLFVDNAPAHMDARWPGIAAELVLGAGRHDISVRDAEGHGPVLHLVVVGGENGAPIDVGATNASHDVRPASTTPSTDASSSALPPPIDSGERAPSRSALPVVLIVSGATAAVVGAVLFFVGLGDVSKVQNATAGSEWAHLRSANDQAPIFTGAGAAMVGVGAAVAVLGVVLRLGESSGESHASAPLTNVAVDVGLGSIAVHGAF